MLGEPVNPQGQSEPQELTVRKEFSDPKECSDLKDASKRILNSMDSVRNCEIAEILDIQGAVVTFESYSVTGDDLKRLQPGHCLNDSIINFYGILLETRSRQSRQQDSGYPRVYLFNTYFSDYLRNHWQNPAKVRKWARKVNGPHLLIVIFSHF
jgi:Ulp1 family protease